MRSITIERRTNDETCNIALDTLEKGKQALIFCSTKRGAEAQAERIAVKVKTTIRAWSANAEAALKAVSSPTKQCKRLAKCLARGVAFHHAGLHSKQRALIEQGFREGTVSIICSTPTLAMGLDLPAFRVIIRDLKRFGGHGLQDIPVLEYEQMAGRAGRPGKEAFGEAIILAQTPDQAATLTEHYIRGEPEEIFSKLAVEPVLRTYVLSLIAAGFLTTRESLYDFFAHTFYAKQYGDTRKLHRILDAMTQKLLAWGFLAAAQDADFVPADKMRDGVLSATPVGKRVAELYLDPFTARHIIEALGRATPRTKAFAWLHCLASCLELRPLLRPRTKEYDELVALPAQHELLINEPAQWSPEYDEFLATLKTAQFLNAWIDETREDALLERFGIGPGEVHMKLERVDWLLYAAEELARIKQLRDLRAPLAKLRLRLKHGAREELLPLLKLKGIGRVRARTLFTHGIRTIAALKTAEASTLAALVGKALALDIKRQVGIELSPEKIIVKKGKRKGQRSMHDY
ncbi:hypothetical protein D6789_00700 [Candidatus Woesearchaeota archaeon]|nr:MAG: hypothetical protein D6789_00700 [Candidatus Woesearchaeota archaeon]